MRRVIAFVLVYLLWSAPVLAGELAEFRSRRYEVRTDLPLAEARGLAGYMDDVYDEYTRRLANFQVRNSERIRLYLFRDQAGYLGHLAGLGIGGQNTGGMFFVTGGDAGLATFVRGQRRQRMLHTLQHEGFHQFAYERIGRGLPIWANEGLAEYFGAAVPQRGRLRLGQFDDASVTALKLAVRDGRQFGFEELLSMTDEEWSLRVSSGDPNAGLMYLQSWSMVHFLLHGGSGRFQPMFEAYLHNIKRGVEPMPAFVDAFGTDDIGSFERAWAGWVLDELEPDALSTAGDRLEFLGAGLRKLHEQGVSPGTMDELKTELKGRGFRLRTWSSGVVRTLSADQDELFDAPPAPRGKPSSLEIVPPRTEKLPPGIAVRGLGSSVQLVWRFDEDGGVVGEVEFR